MSERFSLWTRAVAGEPPDPAHGAIGTPVVQATSFVVKPGEVGFSAADMRVDQPHFYARWSSPTVRVLEQRLADLDDGEDAVCFAGGMAAVSGLLLHLLRAGDHAIVSEICYAGVAELARDGLRRLGIEITFADLSDLEEVRAALRPNTRLVWAETPVTRSCAWRTSRRSRRSPTAPAPCSRSTPPSRRRSGSGRSRSARTTPCTPSRSTRAATATRSGAWSSGAVPAWRRCARTRSCTTAPR